MTSQKGGRLFMLGLVGRPQVDLREGQRVHRKLPVRWIPIPEPDPDPVINIDQPGANSCFSQGYEAGGALFNRLEGIWRLRYGFVFTSTSGGDAKNVNDDGYREGFGQVWRYIPKSNSLVLEYELPGGGTLDSPDNITVSTGGGILLCEDDAGSSDGDTHPLATGITDVNRLVGIGTRGDAFEFAANRSTTRSSPGRATHRRVDSVRQHLRRRHRRKRHDLRHHRSMEPGLPVRPGIGSHAEVGDRV